MESSVKPQKNNRKFITLNIVGAKTRVGFSFNFIPLGKFVLRNPHIIPIGKIMAESFIANSVVTNLLMQIISLHECEVVIHVLNDNATQDEYSFISEMSFGVKASVLIQDLSVDMSLDTCPIGKACITSLSEDALANVAFTYPCKRPVKILLGSVYSVRIPKPDYEPNVVENPPVISIMNTSLSIGRHLIGSISKFNCI